MYRTLCVICYGRGKTSRRVFVGRFYMAFIMPVRRSEHTNYPEAVSTCCFICYEHVCRYQRYEYIVHLHLTGHECSIVYGDVDRDLYSNKSFDKGPGVMTYTGITRVAFPNDPNSPSIRRELVWFSTVFLLQNTPLPFSWKRLLRLR